MGLQAKLREWIDSHVAGPDRLLVTHENLRHWQSVLAEAYTFGPAAYSPERLIETLKEQGYDSAWAIGGLLNQLRARRLSGENDRLRAVDRSRLAYDYDVQFQHDVKVWTDFGFGQRIEIKPRDPKLAGTWGEFWNARRNTPLLKQRKLHKLSYKILKDGEIFFIFYASNADGKATLRKLDTKEIKEKVHEKGDSDIPLFYVRHVTGGDITVPGDNGTLRNVTQIYYPDWQATDEQLDAVELPRGAVRADRIKTGPLGTNVVVCHAALNESDEGRGWPQFYQLPDWAKVYRELVRDYAAVARANAMYIREMTTGGGSRAVDAVRAKFQSGLGYGSGSYSDTNPPASAASHLVHNKAVTTKEVPLNRGAGDASTVSMAIMGQMSAASDVPPHFAGRPDAMQNRAVARETSRPFFEAMERYQEFWADVFQDWVEIIAMLEGRATGREFGDKTADVTMESPLALDPDEIARIMGANTEAAAKGAMAPDVAARANEKLLALALMAFGVKDAGSVLEEPEEGGEAEAVDMAEGLGQIARVIGENMAGGDVGLGVALEWAIAEGIEAVSEQMNG